MKAYAFTLNDKQALKKSSSGGAFYALASHVLENKGVVYGAAFTNTGEVKYAKAETLEELYPLMTSKYVDCPLEKGVITNIKDDVATNRLVLVVGAPCQINLLSVLYKNNVPDNLWLVDFVCHGAPKKEYWAQYMKEMKIDPTQEINFRDKTHGWENYSFKYNGKLHDRTKDPYFYFFLNNYTLKESCYKCPAKGENRKSDLTLSDAWGIDKIDLPSFNSDGTSIIYENTTKIKFLNLFNGQPSIKQIPSYICKLNNPSFDKSSSKPDDFQKINENIKKYGFLFASNSKKKIRKSFFRQKVKSLIVIFLSFINSFRLIYYKGVIKSKTIGIVSDYGYNNFGNKLQSFALQTLVRQSGYKPILITYYDCPKNVFFEHIKKKSNPFYTSRPLLIFRASKKYEKVLVFKSDKSSIRKINNLTKLIFGSDQIWNFNYHKDLDFMLGSFNGASINIPFYSYAASVGVSKIDEKYLDCFELGLAKFSCLSFRELPPANLSLENEKEVRVDLDPTLLLDSSLWSKHIRLHSKIKMPKNKYCLKYCLGSDSRFYESVGEKLNNLDVVDCLNKKSNFYFINQFDFINLIKNASLVFTDSFHAVVFSILFKVPFFVYERDGIFSESINRIIKLFSIFNIDKSLIGSDIIFPENDLDWKNYYLLKENSINYLLSIIK